MKKLDQKGIAPLSIGIAVIIIIGVSIGTPVAIDGMEVDPDHPLYGLGRVGESIRETFAGDQEFYIERAERRREEFLTMKEKGLAEEYQYLIAEANDLIDSAIEQTIQSPVDNEKLSRAEEELGKHLEVLEDLYETVPENAQPAIILAIERSDRGNETITDLDLERFEEREEVSQELQEVRETVETERSEIKEQIREASPGQIPKIVQETEINSAQRTTERVEELGEKYEEIPEIAENMIDQRTQRVNEKLTKATERSRDNEMLNRAKEAENQNVEVLENVREKVPEVAQPAIDLAISRSTKNQAVIARTQVQQTEDNLGEEMRERLGQGLQEKREKNEQLRNRVRENMDAAKEATDIENEVNKISQNVNISTARDLQNMAKEMADIENEAQAVPEVLGMAGRRTEAAARSAVDNRGLERAMKAMEAHENVLREVENKVPEQAREAIQNAIRISQNRRGQLENIMRDLAPGERIPRGNLGPIFDNEDDENRGPPFN